MARRRRSEICSPELFATLDRGCTKYQLIDLVALLVQDDVGALRSDEQELLRALQPRLDAVCKARREGRINLQSRYDYARWAQSQAQARGK